MKKIFVLMALAVFLTGCGKTGSLDVIGEIQIETIENSSDDAFHNSLDPSFEERNLEILAECKNRKIERSIDAAIGATLLINAQASVDGITGVSQYEYVLTDITEEMRTDLFKSVFSEKSDRAEYDERNDVWTLEIDAKIRNYFLYQISYSNGGTNIPGEQIIILENRYYDLYPFEDNRLRSASDSTVDLTLDDAVDRCGLIVDSITNTGDYAADYVHAYGNNGRRPYLKVVFKRILDGMPVTAYNDMRFLIDDDGVEKVTGSVFSVREIGLEKTLLSLDEAVRRLQEQAVLLDLEGESQMTISEITLEYVVIISDDGRILITPVWRFLLGKDEDERNFLRQKILGIDAVTGELIWEERGETM